MLLLFRQCFHISTSLGISTIIIRMTNASKAGSSSFPPADVQVTRLGLVSGDDGKQNEVIFCGSVKRHPIGNVLFFGGDVQDYSEDMLAHRDNHRHNEWNLEATASILARRFLDHHIWVIKPAVMQIKTFSVYSNFVVSNEIGGPTHTAGQKSWVHLQKLLKAATDRMSEIVNSDTVPVSFGISFPLVVVGFSKGCVVLNQLLYDLEGAQSDEREMGIFLHRLEAMYWLDGGHSSGYNTWITDQKVLKSLVGTGIQVHSHVTPYQVRDSFRPWIGKEHKLFVQRLKKLGVSVHNALHFEQDGCLENHFNILKEF